MANVSFDGVDKLIQALEKADLFDEQTQEEILYAGGDILVDCIREEMNKSAFNISGLTKKVRYGKIKYSSKSGQRSITISPYGKNKRGERNATVLFVLNYGRKRQMIENNKVLGAITGGHFWTKGTQNAEKRIEPKINEIVNRKFKERGLI